MIGENIDGAIRYNEKKVKEGMADLLLAHGFPKDTHDLSLSEKSAYFRELVSRNRSKKNCLHISLNFHSDDILDQDKLREIAAVYMEKIGFADQPYLLYHHYDAGHPHVHIVTTQIRTSGRPLPIHYIAKLKSEPARPAIEQQFGLIPAKGRKGNFPAIPPLDPAVYKYGEGELKAAVSNIVRSVVANYRYSNLAELNAALRQFNVTATRGTAGSLMYEKGGLRYSALDENGDMAGTPIKASAIYSRPTLSSLEKRFSAGHSAKKNYMQRVRLLVNHAFRNGSVSTFGSFQNTMRSAGIEVVKSHEGAELFFVDNKTRIVFSGIELGKGYGALSIEQEIAREVGKDRHETTLNKAVVRRILSSIDFASGISGVLCQLATRGIIVDASYSRSGTIRFRMGYVQFKKEGFWEPDDKLQHYFLVNGLTPDRCFSIEQYVTSSLPGLAITYQQESLGGIDDFIAQIDRSFANAATTFFHALREFIVQIMHAEHAPGHVPYELKRKRKKRT